MPCCSSVPVDPTRSEARTAEAKHLASASPEAIHSAVRAHYTSAAEKAGGCCADSTAELGYDEARLDGVPGEVREASLGCGSPVDAARLGAGEVVVDLGSGAGLDVVLAAHAVGAGGRVYGVDMTPAMLEKSRAQIARLGLAQVTILEGDIEALPLDDGTADVVISNCVINLAPDKSRVFREANRVLRPGGRIVFADLVRSMPAGVEAADLSSWSACVAGAVTLEEYGVQLRAAGFDSIGTINARDYELHASGCSEEGCAPGGACCESGTDCCGAEAKDTPALRSVTISARKPV
jgi:SAM-dependent methyltransferase